MLKRCYKCGDTKDLELFSKDSSRPDGRSNRCKECRKKVKANPRTEFTIKSEKICVKCDNPKPIAEFRKNSRSSDGRNARCKLCQSDDETAKQRHRLPVRKQQLRDHHAHNIKLCQEYVVAYLSQHPCVDCGENTVVCLDFDHIDPSTKSASICALAKRGTCLNRLITEIAKCEVRCANCHRKRTAVQHNYWKLNHETI